MGEKGVDGTLVPDDHLSHKSKTENHQGGKGEGDGHPKLHDGQVDGRGYVECLFRVDTSGADRRKEERARDRGAQVYILPF